MTLPPIQPCPSQDQRRGITYYPNLVQGSDEWLAARCGMLTASEIGLIVTPGQLKAANNDKSRAHLYELLAQRITEYVEPRYVSDDMLRGQDDEVFAREAYAEHFAPVQEMGFVVNDRWGFPIGWSPDGLVGEDGAIECKSRRQKFQVQTIVEHVSQGKNATIPSDYILQVQTALLVSERKWLDFISYCGGLPMVVIRVYPDPEMHTAIVDAAAAFEGKLREAREHFRHAPNVKGARLIPTERREFEEIVI